MRCLKILSRKDAANRFLAAILGALVSLTAGCSVGPNYVRPTAEVPRVYSVKPKNVIQGPWWEVFKDPALSALEAQVNISNQNIAEAEATYQEARALVQAARSNYFPLITGGASASRTQKSAKLGGSLTTKHVGPVASDYLLTGDATWELDVWGKIRRTVEASRANAQASAGDLEAARLSAQAELAQDYFLLRGFDAQKQLLDKTVADYQKFLDLTKNRYTEGVASKADVLQAETQLKITIPLAIDLGVQRAQLEHAIALLVGKPASGFSIPISPLNTPVPRMPVGVPSELLKRRPDIAAAERRVVAANAQIGIAKAAYFPAVTLSASGGFEAAVKLFSWPARFWSLGSSFVQTLFDGGLRRAQSDQAKAAYNAAVASYRQTVLTGFQEVEDNLTALQLLKKEARAQNDAVKTAQESLDFVINQYKSGTVRSLDVILAETALLAAQKSAVDILSRRMTASVLLIKALGGGWAASNLPSNKDLSKFRLSSFF